MSSVIYPEIKIQKETMSSKQNLKDVRNQGLDKFYTLPEVAKKYISIVSEKVDGFDKFDLIVEPSAGNGSFFSQLPREKTIGIDISPDGYEILKQDFFDYTPNQKNSNILVIGNPPFGRVSSLAIKFFNHAASFAKVIAFIIPRTFKRVSIQSKLNPQFHLLYSEDIETSPCAFVPKMSVKCCFQIWIWKTECRIKKTLNYSHSHWKFLSLGPNDANGQPTPPHGADFAIRAYGGKCGDVIFGDDEIRKLRPKSWHFIVVNKEEICVDELIRRFKNLDYSISNDTARQNSIGRGELVELYNQDFK